MNSKVNIKYLIEEIKTFVDNRDWDSFHSPRNLAISLAIESAELLECFQWEDNTFSELRKDKNKMEEISQEIADVLIYSLRLIDKLDLDFDYIIKEKIKLNKAKYPITNDSYETF